jgi:hypothetical protein
MMLTPRDQPDATIALFHTTHCHRFDCQSLHTYLHPLFEFILLAADTPRMHRWSIASSTRDASQRQARVDAMRNMTLLEYIASVYVSLWTGHGCVYHSLSSRSTLGDELDDEDSRRCLACDVIPGGESVRYVDSGASSDIAFADASCVEIDSCEITR